MMAFIVQQLVYAKALSGKVNGLTYFSTCYANSPIVAQEETESINRLTYVSKIAGDITSAVKRVLKQIMHNP